MTEEQLEVAARKYCDLTGMDPDAKVPDPHNSTMMWVTVPAWQSAVYKIYSHNLILEAIEYAKTNQP